MAKGENSRESLPILQHGFIALTKAKVWIRFWIYAATGVHPPCDKPYLATRTLPSPAGKLVGLGLLEVARDRLVDSGWTLRGYVSQRMGARESIRSRLRIYDHY